MHNRRDRDLLSELPLEIIHIILASVPIGDVVRTSILSRKWRYIWTSLPQLNFDENCMNSIHVDEESLKNFITQVLRHHKGPIHEFKLSVPSMMSWPKTDHWLRCLSKNDISDLSITIRDNDYAWHDQFIVHSNLYYCQNLKHLNLNRCELHLPPLSFKEISRLRSVDLRNCFISSKAIENLVAYSPLLERLVLINSGGSELRISAPNLKHLYTLNGIRSLCLYAPLLTEMLVGFGDVRFTKNIYKKKSPTCNHTKFLGGFMNLEKLVIVPPVIKCLSVGIESCRYSLVLHHLKIIQIYMVSLEDIKERSLVYCLIMGAPNLQELEILINPLVIKADESKVRHVSIKNLGWTPNFTLDKLRVIKIVGVCHLPHEMELIEFLLKSSPVLETMRIHHSHTLNIVEIQNLSADLQMYRAHGASSNAKILFNECSSRELWCSVGLLEESVR